MTADRTHAGTLQDIRYRHARVTTPRREDVSFLLADLAAATERARSAQAASQSWCRRAMAAEAQLAAAREALVFYADPDTYFAIAMFGDAPHGDFFDDLEDLGPSWGEKPGKRARAALAASPPDTGDTA